MKKGIIIGLICITLSVGTVLTYSAFSHKVTKTGSIKTAQIGYCRTNDITNLSECLIRNDAQTDLESALLTIDERSKNLDTDNITSVEPINLYATNQKSFDYTGYGYVRGSTVVYFTEKQPLYSDDSTPENVTFNNETGYYTYKNAVSGSFEEFVTTESDMEQGIYKYTCFTGGTTGSCNTMYIVYTYEKENDNYYLGTGLIYDYKEVGTSQSNPGLYKVEDEYTTDTDNDGVLDSNFSYVYRGDVNNNWIEYAGALWRVVRINGNGSVRMIYAGTANSNDPTITLAPYQNEVTGATYVGYMYNPDLILTTTPSIKLVSEGSTYRTESFPRYIASTTSSYYFFDSSSFDINTNCSEELQTCTLTCTNFNEETGVGDNCVRDTWSNLASNESNYDKDHVDSTTYHYRYTGDYKYTCWTTTASVDGKNISVSCTAVSEILSVQANGDSIHPSYSRVRYHGFFSESRESAVTNVEDSRAKAEVDAWYEGNILNQVDSNGDLLSDYLSDEVFCNDRTLTQGTGYNYDTGGASVYQGEDRLLKSGMSPSLICGNQNDRFTVSNTYGNSALTYPIGLITMDEVALAGSHNNGMNFMYYLFTRSRYWTMTPARYDPDYNNARMFYVHQTGRITVESVSNNIGIRPVINLASNVLIVDGTGTEDDPYKVALKEKKTTLAEYVTQEVYTGVDGENDLYYHDGTGNYTNASLEAGDNSYRYAGADPDNYVCFGINASTCPEDNLYRIIGVFDGKVKLIKADYTTVEQTGDMGDYYGMYNRDSRYYIGNMDINNITAYYWNNATVNNNWSESNLNKINLNETYLTYLGEWANKISDHAWKVGGISGTNGTRANIQTVYNYEVGENSIDTTYNAKVGLMYVSDYGYSAYPDAWSTTLSSYSNTTTVENNWLYLGLYEWLITPYLNQTNTAFAFGTSGFIGYDVVNDSSVDSIRPTFYLNSDVLYLKGTGTKIDPIIISTNS